MNINNIIFEMLQVAIGNRAKLSYIPTPEEFSQIYCIAKKQYVLGICFAAIDKLNLSKLNFPPNLLYQWLGMSELIKKQNKKVNNICIDLSQHFNLDGLSFCIMKGQQVGRYYGELSSLRQSGDIDVWVLGGKKFVVNYVQCIKPTKSISRQHIQLEIYPNTDVEVHYIPAELHCPWYDFHLKKFLYSNCKFSRIHDKTTLSGVYVPTDKFNIVHLTAHAFRHLFGEGMTLRQLMDLYFVLMKWEGNLEEKQSICKVFKHTGMMTFASALMGAMSIAFRMPKDNMYCDPNTQNGYYLLNNIMNLSHDRLVLFNESSWHRFWRIQKYNIGLLKLSPWEVVWTPIWRIYNWSWMKMNGYTY